jgi:hypothetical protein
MATQPQNSPEFLQFVNYMGVQLTMDNMVIFTDLYVNFTGFVPQYPCNSFAEKFILWKRFYDEFKDTQQQILNTHLFNTPPKDPRQLKTSTVQLPDELQQINSEDNLFQNFILKNDNPTKPDPPQTRAAETPSHNQQTTYDLADIALKTIDIEDNTVMDGLITENIEVIEQTDVQKPDSQVNTPPPPTSPPHRGKNLQQMEIIYQANDEGKPEPIPSKPKPIPRKRKRKEETDEDVTIGPGRPSKDTALLRDAKNEDSGNDDDSQYTLCGVQLLSGNGTLRKKTKLLTKNENDIKCFSIRHYVALEYIAEKKKKAFAIIKYQRQKLKKINYLQQNTLKDIKDVQDI